MRFLPLTREVELESSNPEGAMVADAGTYFYRDGNNMFWFVKDNVRTRINLVKRIFALQYQNQTWYQTIPEDLIIFAHQYELWKKVGEGENSTGWQFVGYQRLDATAS